jgi:hypothetical protein
MELDAKETTQGKIVLVVLLYITLAVIVLFNLGFYRQMCKNWASSETAANIATQMDINEDTKDTSVTSE